MASCKNCGEDDEDLITLKVGGKRMKLCEECAEEIELDQELAEASEAAVQQMMGFKGRR
jgi:ribosome-binding protein aMBF1 (putative translation factor)